MTPGGDTVCCNCLQGLRLAWATIGRLFIYGKNAMNTLTYLFGAFGFVVLVAATIVVLLSTAAQSQDKRRDDLTSRRIAQQPWDAQSVDGRGIR